jgi:superfamily II DNA/RNA helicase
VIDEPEENNSSKVIPATEPDRQTAFFSATMPRDVRRIAERLS